nr:hypothetical protein [uncultured Halomonas sp.]
MEDRTVAQGETFEIDGDSIPMLFRGSVRVVDEPIPTGKAKAGHVRLRVTGTLVIIGDHKYGPGDIIEVPESQVGFYRTHTEPADRPTAVTNHGHAPMSPYAR